MMTTFAAPQARGRSAKSFVGIAAAMLVAIPAASFGEVMSSGMISLNIPSSGNGLTINLVTGESTTGFTSVAGWDVHISGPMIFSAPTRRPAENSGFVSRVYPPGEGGVHNLPLNFQVGPPIPFLTGIQPTTGDTAVYGWDLPGDANYVGVYFYNEATAAYHYGWMRFCMSGGLTDEPRALIEYAYESTPATPILVGAGGVGDPGNCGGLNCFETSAGGLANTKSSADTDCMVMTADPAGQTLLFQNDIQFNVNTDFANWENITINGPAGAPADVEWLPAPTDPGPWDAYFRTLTLRDVNLAMKRDDIGNPIVLRWLENGTGQTGLALENASIRFQTSPFWQSDASLTIEATGGTSAIEDIPGGRLLTSPTTLKVANGATLGFVNCGSLEPDQLPSARCYFNSGALVSGGEVTAENTADIDGGVLEINRSHVIYPTGESLMSVRNGGQILVTGGNETTLQSSRIHVNGGSLKLGDGDNFLRTLYNPVLHPTTGADLILENASVELGQSAQIFSSLVEVRGSSTVTLGTIVGEFPTQFTADGGVLLTGPDPILTLAGFRNFATPRLLLEFAPANTLLRITEFSSLDLIAGTAPNAWTKGRMEIEENAELLIREGSTVGSSIPLQNDGIIKVDGGRFKPHGAMTGSGLLQIDSDLQVGLGVLGPFGSDADATFTAAPDIIMNSVSTLELLIAPNQNKAQRLIAESSLLLGGSEVTQTGVILDLDILPVDDVALPVGTKFAIVDYPDGNDLGRGFIRDDLSLINEGDEITSGFNTYRVQYVDADYGAANGGNSSVITLTVTANTPPYAYWTAGFATLTDPDPGLDFDRGGLPTGVEWVVDGNPTDNTDDRSVAPTFDNTSDPNYFTFTYRRSDAANADADTSIAVEYGSDLVNWTVAADDATDILITETDDGAGVGVDLVEVKLARSLAVDGKLFARLKVMVTIP